MGDPESHEHLGRIFAVYNGAFNGIPDLSGFSVKAFLDVIAKGWESFEAKIIVFLQLVFTGFSLGIDKIALLFLQQSLLVHEWSIYLL